MKKLALFAILLGLTLPAQAQLLPFGAICKSIEENHEFLKKYKELPFGGGPAVLRLSNGNTVNGFGKIYVDPNEKGWTVLIEFAEAQKSCVLTMGDSFEPIFSDEVYGDPS